MTFEGVQFISYLIIQNCKQTLLSFRRRANARNSSTSLLLYGGTTYFINSFDYPNLLLFNFPPTQHQFQLYIIHLIKSRFIFCFPTLAITFEGVQCIPYLSTQYYSQCNQKCPRRLRVSGVRPIDLSGFFQYKLF